MANTTDLTQIAAELLTSGTGLLAADESADTANEKRLERVGAEGTPENRRRFRQLIFTAPGIEEYLSGIILYKETLNNRTDDGVLFPELLASRGIIFGVKVDEGKVPLEGFPGETVTQGLDDLALRLAEYYEAGARFTKWRAAFPISDVTPSSVAVRTNAVMLARFAAISQAAGMVPIVEPEVLYNGDHDLARAEEVTTFVLQTVMQILEEHLVALDGTILKTSMVLAGKENEVPSAPEEIAEATLRTFRAAVPERLAGIVFLSGGQEAVQATENLNAIARAGAQPWPITFSFSRALQMPMLEKWRGDDANKEAAQAALLARCKLNGAAQQGMYEGEK